MKISEIRLLNYEVTKMRLEEVDSLDRLEKLIEDEILGGELHVIGEFGQLCHCGEDGLCQ